MASTGECGGTSVTPAMSGTPKLGVTRLWGRAGMIEWSCGGSFGGTRRRGGMSSEGWGGGGSRSPRLPFPSPPPGGPVLEPSGARGARGGGGGGARGPPWPPLCCGRRSPRSGPLATWAGPVASRERRGGGWGDAAGPRARHPESRGGARGDCGLRTRGPAAPEIPPSRVPCLGGG
jgi:hypothetical protein